MNRIKNRLDREMSDVDFELDLARIKAEYSAYRRRKRTAIIAAAVVIVIAGLLTERLLSGIPTSQTASDIQPAGNIDSASSAQEHSFILTASAAEVSEEYMNTLSQEDRELLLSARGCKIEVEYSDSPMTVNGPDGDVSEQRFKVFRITGSTPIIAYGSDIDHLVFHSDNSSFYYPEADESVNDQTVEYDSDYPLNSALYWLVPEEFNQWCEDMNKRNDDANFSLLPDDKVTVTAVFADGTECSKELKLRFNEYGYLVAETEDGTRYNDYDDSTEFYPFDYDSHILDTEKIASATVTFSDTGQETEIANISALVSELWELRLYEELPDIITSKSAVEIKLELSDGGTVEVYVSETGVAINKEHFYRAAYESIDNLLGFCHGLQERNEEGYAVYADY